MLPEVGSGDTNIGGLPTPSSGEYPFVFSVENQANVQYHVADWLRRFGAVYCEVSCGDAGQIDLVWDQRTSNCTRRVGIEIKTESGGGSHIETREQIEKYKQATMADANDAGLAWLDTGEVAQTDQIYLFDEVWVLYVGNRSRWGADGPEDGWLTYSQETGRLAYEIDEAASREVSTPPLSPGEEDYTARLWSHYAKRGRCLTAEGLATLPADRFVAEGTVKYSTTAGTTRWVDLVVGRESTYAPVTADSAVHAIEVKTNLSGRERLTNQLSMYRDSGMYSHVSLAVPSEILSRAHDVLEEDFPEIGLLLVEQDSVHEITAPSKRPLEQPPVRRDERVYQK